jgi:hypothetical protein
MTNHQDSHQHPLGPLQSQNEEQAPGDTEHGPLNSHAPQPALDVAAAGTAVSAHMCESCDAGRVDSVDGLVRLGRVTAEQWGLITFEQAEPAEVGASLLHALSRVGLLTAAGEDVFQLSGAPLPVHLDIKVAWLRQTPDTLA